MLLDNRTNVFSQNGEDGIVEKIFEELGIECGQCCEFGAWDGKHFSNTFRLIKEKNWTALYIEGDPEKYKDLLKTCEEYPNITPINTYVNKDNLDEIITENGFSKDIDLLSIDVDSIDYEIWKNLLEVKPKVVIIEPSNQIPLWDRTPVYPAHENGGANPHILKELAKQKGYYFVCTTGNLFFVRNDLTVTVHDNVEFPWWLDNNKKQIVSYLSTILKNEEDYLNFSEDIIKYIRGFKLGYMSKI